VGLAQQLPPSPDGESWPDRYVRSSLSVPFTISIDGGNDGHAYLAAVVGPAIRLVRAGLVAQVSGEISVGLLKDATPQERDTAYPSVGLGGAFATAAGALVLTANYSAGVGGSATVSQTELVSNNFFGELGVVHGLSDSFFLELGLRIGIAFPEIVGGEVSPIGGVRVRLGAKVW
jgi:hypothetical protein